MADTIGLVGMSFFGRHGVLPEERALGQQFVVDVWLECDLAAAGRTDDLRQTVDYSEVHDLVRAIVTGPPCALIEAVAERIAAAILASQPRVLAVTVQVGKPQVRLGDTVLTRAEVRIRRERRG